MRPSIRRTVFILALLPAAAFAADGDLSWRKDKAEPDPAKRVQVAAAQAAPQTAEASAQEAAQPAPTAEPAAAPAQEAQANADAAPVAAPMPAPAAGNGLVGAPPAGKGQVVFFRPSKFAGAAVGFKVREGQTELGKLRSGKYFVAVVEPGQHQYTVHSEAEDVLTMEVEAGETYYVQGTINMGFLVGRPNLSPSDAATFDGMAAKLERAQ
ncbi:MAG TPA: DUF2846 domain-containing protein [Luteimonas sp.]|nr:DUF2846 domain-containing protein [Luteimonas sp.]